MPSETGPLDGLSVLVVEDNDDCRFLTEHALTAAGATVEGVPNGAMGYDKALHGTYGLILLDVQMPGMDGNALTRRLRREGYRKPIIALTAAAMAEEQIRGFVAGHDDYLTKPIAAKVLVEAVARICM